MTTSQLSVVNGAIDVPGVAFRRNGVTFTKPVKLEPLNKLLAAVAEIEGGTSWWFGDIGIRIQAQSLAEKKGDDYAAGRAEILGISAGHWWDCVTVSRFFPPSERSEGSWSHHEVAMRGAGGPSGDLKKAKAWLRQAQEMDWSVSDLRKQVNLSLATFRAPETPPEKNPFEVIDQVDAWLAKKPEIPVVTPDQAKAQVVRWQALIDFVHQLEAIASKAQPL